MKNSSKRDCSPEAVEANKKIYNEHFDLQFVREFNRSVLFLLQQAYFRPQAIGFEEMPKRNNPAHPVILATNHSGMAFPWDGMIFGCFMFEKFNYEEEQLFRPLASPLLSQTPAMHPFFMRYAWKRAGGIDATFLNFETMMHLPKGNLLIYPEGVPGIGKGFNRRYKLQRMASSFVRMSLKYRTDIVSFATINAEYVAPLMYSVKWIDRLFQKIGVPFMPLGPLTIFIPLQPWTFYLSLPVKMTYVMGQRIKPYEWTDKPFEELSEEEILGIRDRVKEIMQADLSKAKEDYGKSPYQLGNFFKTLWKYKSYFPYNLPLGWGFLFHEFERQWVHEEAYKTGRVDIYLGWGAIVRFIWRNPITLAYFVPIIGWFILVAYGRRKWRDPKYRIAMQELQRADIHLHSK